MLGQRAMKLSADLPGHHDLDRLWTAAFPFAKPHAVDDHGALDRVRQVVAAYHSADPRGYSFRYPVTMGNKAVDHASYVHAFSQSGHAAELCNACDILDRIIKKIQMAEIFAQVWASEPEAG